MSNKKYNLNLFIIFVIIVIISAVFIWKKYDVAKQANLKEKTPSTMVSALFFLKDKDFSHEFREIECDNEKECIRDTVIELLAGSLSDLDDEIPEGVSLNDFSLQDDVVFVKLNSKFSSESFENKKDEKLAVYQIVNTVCYNFPKIKKVKIDIEDNLRLKSLKLEEPLTPVYEIKGFKDEEVSRRNKK